MTVEVRCSSCHTRYRVDEQVLPEGTPTFKCSRCGHVFSVEPRKRREVAADPGPAIAPASAASKPAAASRPGVASGSETKLSPWIADPQPKLGLGTRAGASPPGGPAAPAPKADTPSPAATRPGGGLDQQARPSAEQDEPNLEIEELMARPFRAEPAPPQNGENFAFDFSDEAVPEKPGNGSVPTDIGTKPATAGELDSTAPSTERWEVGEELENPALEAPKVAIARSARAQRRPITPDDIPEALDEAAAPVFNQGVTRTARFFLAMCLLVAAGYSVATYAIHNAPAAALDLLNRLPVVGARFVPPMVPAQMVALRDVHAEYRRGRDGRLALVVQGEAENVSPTALHTIRISSRLWTMSGNAVARQVVYCGNSLGPRGIAQMTTHEIEFFQQLPPPRTFALASSSSCPFAIVFADPPTQLTHFDLAVTAAEPAVASDDTDNTPAS